MYIHKKTLCNGQTVAVFISESVAVSHFCTKVAFLDRVIKQKAQASIKMNRIFVGNIVC